MAPPASSLGWQAPLGGVMREAPPKGNYDRKFGTSADDKAALIDSMTGYAGTYRIGGDKLINTPEVI